jgi:zinc transport system ATP-binding protein
VPVTPGETPLIELRSASFGYGERRVVDRVDLTVRRGEVVALLGPNGCGKSTLVRGLLGLVEQQGGEVRLLGVPRERFRDFTRIGYVPQHHTLTAAVRATVTEVVEVGRLPHRPWWRPPSRLDREVVREAVAAVGLADRADEEVARLSGGQQRRVLIARALAGRPDVLVMDEPTAGVDTASQEALAVVLERLAAEGTSMVVVTHELEALRDVVTRVVCMQAGRVDLDGTPEEYATHRAAHDPGSTHHHDPTHDGPPQPVMGAPLDAGPGGNRG